MSGIGVEEFYKIRRGLKSIKDFARYTYYTYPRGMLFSILIQKKINWVKIRYHEYVARLKEVEEFWRKYKKFPSWLKLPPIMRVRILLKSLGFNKREIAKLLKDPEDKEFSNLLWNAIYRDFVYSPIAVRSHFAKGKIGERILKDYLESKGLDFKTEKEIKEGKTPDFYLNKPIILHDMEINWIESKALFADKKLHAYYSKRQYNPYFELYGAGLVVYWNGFVKMNSTSKNFVISSGYEFESVDKIFLNDMKIFIADDTAEKVSELYKAGIFKWRYGDEMHSTRFYHGILEYFDSIDRIKVIEAGKDETKFLKRVLKNMGFEVLVFP